MDNLMSPPLHTVNEVLFSFWDQLATACHLRIRQNRIIIDIHTKEKIIYDAIIDQLSPQEIANLTAYSFAKKLGAIYSR